MIDLISSVGKWVFRQALVTLRAIPRPDFVGRYLDDRPIANELRAGEIVIVGTPELKKWACFPCPDECGEMVALNLSKSRRPRWTVETDWLSRVTIHPSIHELKGCHSHYWVKRGRVVWCNDSHN